MENDWALVVGINHYPLTTQLPPLSGAARDAEKFFKWVIDPLGGAVQNDKIHSLLLKSPDASPAGEPPAGPPRPILGEIQTFFDDMKSQLNGRRGRRLYIYLSGHGISPSGVEAARHAALLMANSKPPRDWQNFPGDVWANGARSAACFREVVLVMDCCQDLQEKASVGTHTLGDPVSDARDCHLVELYATEWDSKSREDEFGEPKEKMGIFTHSLLEVLKAGRMDGRLLKESVLKHFSDTPAPNKQDQKPKIGSEEELPLLIFNEAAPAPISPVTVLNHAGSRPRIQFLRLNAGRSSPVDTSTWVLKGDQWHGSLPPGTYEVRMTTGDDRLFIVYAGNATPVDVLQEEVL
jgi:hypothetical protein